MGDYLGNELPPFGNREEGPPAAPEGAQGKGGEQGDYPSTALGLTRVASITPKAEDIIITRMERIIAAAGVSPRYMFNARIPTVQNIDI